MLAPVLSDQTVGVVGSGRDAHDALAGEIGRLLADLEVNLLTSGGGGVMTAVSRAFVAARRRKIRRTSAPLERLQALTYLIGRFITERPSVRH